MHNNNLRWFVKHAGVVLSYFIEIAMKCSVVIKGRVGGLILQL